MDNFHPITNYYNFKLNRGIYLSGHSAGGHLAAMMLMSSFSDFDPFDCELIKGLKLFLN